MTPAAQDSRDAVEPTRRTRVRRHPERAAYDRPTIDTILDEALLCHVGFVEDGQPFVIPTIHARVGDILYLHGSSASRMLERLGSGIPVCVTVTITDGLVLARSAFAHSMNYRSVVVIGTAREVTDRAEQLEAMRAVSEHVTPGRWAEVRSPSDREIRQTRILRVSLKEVSAKIRAGGPKDAKEDLVLPVWAGVLPLELRAAAPLPDDLVDENIAVPEYVARHRLARDGGREPR
jgi:nitroimidazol reductase NimA-like FMN-containing flavoprotein (pyridoxamine 5'-phosphate oxidase superfamily)